jgi:dTDP-4-amino-4,6-dideoxygalactose transaminase
MPCFTLPPSGNRVPLPRLFSTDAQASGTRSFAGAMAARCGVTPDRLLLAASGTAALYAALRGLASLQPRLRAVAVPAWCCPSVPQAVLQAGLDPVLVDIDPSTLGYDVSALREARRHGLLAVVLVHFFGMPQPLPPGDWSGTAFLRDCAQDFDHRPADGVPCFYSFGRGKALNAGHGGALCIPEGGDLLKACLRALAALPESRSDPRPMAVAINLLSEPHLYWAVSRVPGLGLGRTAWRDPLELERASPLLEPVALASLEAYASCRPFYRRLVAAYRDLFSACDGDWATVPQAPADDRLPTRFPVLVREPTLRETLLREAGRHWGGLTRMYPAVLTELPGAPDGLSLGADFPGARRVAREIVTLPITAGLRGREGAFLAFLADLLEGAGALRRARSRAAAAPRRTIAPEAAPARAETAEAREPRAGEDWTAAPAPAEPEEVPAAESERPA